MKVTYNKQAGTARELPTMEKPFPKDFSFIRGGVNKFDDVRYGVALSKYEDHLSSLRTFQISPELKALWDKNKDEAVYDSEKGEFKLKVVEPEIAWKPTQVILDLVPASSLLPVEGDSVQKVSEFAKKRLFQTDNGYCGNTYDVIIACMDQYGKHVLAGAGISGEKEQEELWLDVENITMGPDFEFRPGDIEKLQSKYIIIKR